MVASGSSRKLADKGEKHEGEFADLGQNHGKKDVLIERQAKEPSGRAGDDGLDGYNAHDQAHDQQRIPTIRLKLIDAPTAMKKSPSKTPLNVHVAFELMPEFAAGQHDARQKAPSAGLKPIRIIR